MLGRLVPLALLLGALPLGAQGVIPPATAVDSSRRALPPVEAYHRGFIALKDAGVDRFAAAHPAWDGRGVLIAILDSGVDPSIAGLQTTSDGAPKILDLRDFSHEGRVLLRPIERHGDTLFIGGHRLLGASSVAALSGSRTIWGGALAELPLGAPPASDLDGNGKADDSLSVVVVRGPSGWALFADTQEDGTLANDHPLYDFSVAHESFGWNAGGHPTAVQLAVNLSDSAGVPLLDLFFDTSSHGTHVSGIASGHNLYGVAGFDGVAPGAKLIGLKIANDAESGITVTGSIAKALAYAIEFATARQMPLVVNLSFGVGNEIEGTARIDAIVDSILAVHPDVVMTVSSSNDGPGLSTIGFPGSASRVFSIGATEPRVFNGAVPDDSLPSPLATFSSRGAEIAAPDFAVPGVAYSSVPNFAVGQEQESGTSMAAPYAAGLVARLLSAALDQKRTIPAYIIKQALRISARPVIATTPVESGAGTPDLVAAWKWLDAPHVVPSLAVDVGAVRGRGAVFVVTPPAGDPVPPPGTTVRNVATVTIRRLDGVAPLTLRLQPSAKWIQVPATVTLASGTARFEVTVDPALWGKAGVLAGTIRVETGDESLGALATIPVTVVVPISALARTYADTFDVLGGGTGRRFIPADTGRGIQIEVATTKTGAQVLAMLSEPSGMPFRDGAGSPAGFGDGAALFELSAEDVVHGLYEIDATSTPGRGERAVVTVRRSPVRLGARVVHDTLHVLATSLVNAPVSLRLRAGLIGAARDTTVAEADDTPLRVAFPVPIWASRVLVDTRMPREVWSRYTDFGVTLQDRHGVQLGTGPLNYAFGRTGAELPVALHGDSLVVLLAPGFADASGSHAWSLALSVRFLVDKPITLDEGGSSVRPLPPSATRDERFPLGRLPIVMPGGFEPLLILVGLEGEDHIWTRQVHLRVDAGGTQ